MTLGRVEIRDGAKAADLPAADIWQVNVVRTGTCG